MADARDRGLVVRLRQQTPIPLEVELECAPGEMLALVGPSGSGKSTVLRTIAGLVRVAEGLVISNGARWLDTAKRIALAPRERRVGFVFQHYGLFPHLSAVANVMEAMVDVPYEERERRARDLLARVHLDGLERRLPAELSGGQQQRVAIARALAREPNVLLLDEPFAAVDRATRERLYTELAELRRDLKIPSVLVTHDLDEALMLADRMSVLYRGRTLQSGLPFDVLSRPASAQVAQLVGMKNVFRAGVVGHDPGADSTVIEWRKHRLVADYEPAFASGTQVNWAVPQGQLVLLPKNEHSFQDNVVTGVVIQHVRLGSNAAIAVAIGGADRPPLYMSVPLPVAHAEGLVVGTEVSVSIPRPGIHLMPPGDEEPESASHRRMQPAQELVA